VAILEALLSLGSDAATERGDFSSVDDGDEDVSAEGEDGDARGFLLSSLAGSCALGSLLWECAESLEGCEGCSASWSIPFGPRVAFLEGESVDAVGSALSAIDSVLVDESWSSLW
jgi:hypothetical protein